MRAVAANVLRRAGVIFAFGLALRLGAKIMTARLPERHAGEQKLTAAVVPFSIYL